MTDEAKPQNGGMPEPEGLAEAGEVVRSMGLIFNNTNLYGPNHGVTKQSVDSSFAIISGALAKSPEISFNVAEDDLMVNGKEVELKNPLMKAFVECLDRLGVGSFAITSGISRQKFEDLLEILNAKPEELKQAGGFAAIVKTAGLENVRARTVVYKQITEDEVVVSKGKLEDIGKKVGSGAGGAADGAGALNRVMAMLQGKASSESAETVKDLADISSDAGKMADVIIDVAQDSAGSGGAGVPGAALGDGIVDCLKKVFEGLMNDPAANTRKGKKDLEKTLQRLEEAIRNKLRGMDGIDGSVDQAVAETAETLADELKIDALATEYIKKKKAIEQSESRILRYIKAKGLEKIKGSNLFGKLGDGGIGAEAWGELLLKSGVIGSGSDDGSSGLAAVGHLASLLAGMQEEVTSKHELHEDIAPEELHKVLTDVDREVKALVLQTEQKISDLVKNIREEESEEDAGPSESRGKRQAKKPGMSRKKLLELLAEAVQELCQPLSVIACSIDMVVSGSLGATTDQQNEMLVLASENGARVRTLIDKLLEISGVPETLKPDDKIQASLY